LSAIVGATAASAGARLVTADRRALATYALVGALAAEIALANRAMRDITHLIRSGLEDNFLLLWRAL